ncbi:MAG: protocatechuate 3,4-dioxygenase subunit alpha [Roseobacter sp.]
MAGLKETPSQTAGPYVHIGCMPSRAGLSGIYAGRDLGAEMISGNPVGQRIRLTLCVQDAAKEPVTDALVEIWQAGPDGSFGPSDGFCHWGRQSACPDTGQVVFETLKPGAPAGQAPHILVWIAARGINLALTTRLYFPDEDNSKDPVMRLAGPRKETLIARKTKDGYAHLINLQGADETVFFDV